MSDLISRQAAIDKINERQRKLIYCFGFENDMVKIMDIAKTIISIIPSEQPEIIQCKDCKEYDPIYTVGAGVCGHWNAKTENNAYCSYAERRTDGQR